MNGTSQINQENIFWETPKGDAKFGKSDYTLNKLKREFNLQLDPCASGPEDAMCDTYYTPEQNGLKQEWNVPTIFNPPFKDVEIWVKKAFTEALKHPGIPIVGILPAYTSTPWFHDFIWSILPKENIRFIKGRIRFWEKGQPSKSSPNFDQMIVIWLVRS